MKGQENLHESKTGLFKMGMLTGSVIKADSLSKYFYNFFGSLFNILKKVFQPN